MQYCSECVRSFGYFGETMLREAQPNDQPYGQWSPSHISMLSEQVEENHHTTLLSIFFRVEPVLTTPMCRISSRNGYYVGKLVTVAASVTTQVVMMYHRSRTH